MKKYSEITFYPFNEETKAITPHPTPASKNIPNWYKKQQAYHSDENEAMKKGQSSSTIKRCMPIFDIMNSGYIIYFPCDIYIDATDPEKIVWSIPEGVKLIKRDLISSHSSGQVSEYPRDTDKYHKEVFRVLPFWSISTEDGYSCLFTHPFHGEKVPFSMFSAIVDTDKFITDGHFSMYIEKNFKGVIERGTPMIQVIPFKRENYKMTISSVQDSIIAVGKQRLFLRSKFKNYYRNLLRSKKEYI
jgi:hypothetical protein